MLIEIFYEGEGDVKWTFFTVFDQSNANNFITP